MKKINYLTSLYLVPVCILSAMAFFVMLIMHIANSSEIAQYYYIQIKETTIEYPEMCPRVKEYLEDMKIDEGEFDEFNTELRKIKRNKEKEFLLKNCQN